MEVDIEKRSSPIDGSLKSDVVLYERFWGLTLVSGQLDVAWPMTACLSGWLLRSHCICGRLISCC